MKGMARSTRRSLSPATTAEDVMRMTGWLAGSRLAPLMLVALTAGGLGGGIVVQGREPARIDSREFATTPSPTVLSESDWSAILKEHRRHRQAAVPADGSAL